MTADGNALWTRMSDLRRGAYAGISPLRVFDVLAWMDGSGNADRVRAGRPVDAPVQPPE